MNRFDEKSHSYFITENGIERRVPSVTQVLNDLIPCWKADQWYLDRGNATHACCAMIARGQQFEHDPQIDGQVKACRRFFAEVKPSVLEVEKQLFSAKYGFAGTYDLFSTKPETLKACIVDWKASISAALPYQLAGYALLQEEEAGGRVDYGYGVQLNEDGTYQMTQVYDLRRYKQGFLQLLGAYNIRRACKVKEEGTKE